MYAGVNGKIKIVKLLLRYRANPNLKYKENQSILLWAVKNRKTKLLLQLLRSKECDLTQKDTMQRDLLTIAILNNCSTSTLLLLQAGISADIVYPNKESLIHKLIKENQYNTLKLILSYSSKTLLEQKDAQGYTPLMKAIIYQNIKIVKLLVSHKVNRDISSKDGFQTLQIALGVANQEIIALIVQ
jgi:ankyrin repeat protein